MVATLDKENNIVRVRADWYEQHKGIVDRVLWGMQESYISEYDLLFTAGTCVNTRDSRY